ncbi:MAG: class I SAM-dependent methyltransferase [Bacteroidales bacterium]|nr:class I SAM-dependent methyltransferase [Bacteroidales bacterium]
MDVEQSYNIWASQYDTNQNKTRDLEAVALRETLSGFQFNNCLEIGCGTGKNTEWLLGIAEHVTAIDISEEMLLKAKSKIQSQRVIFLQADITREWLFANKKYDLVTFSLVLEHIENLDEILRKVAIVVKPRAYIYIGELHPFKQYSGTKARFDTSEGQQIVQCYDHHISNFTQAAKIHGFALVDLNEYFDESNRTLTPRILTLLLRKI